jgi:hypothetical protein
VASGQRHVQLPFPVTIDPFARDLQFLSTAKSAGWDTKSISTGIVTPQRQAMTK